MRPRALFVALAFVTLASVAHAGDEREESRAAFRRGVAAIQKEDWETAKAELTRAYTLFPHPSILLNLGLARAKTADYAGAERDLVRFLADDTQATGEEVETARRTLADVKTHLGTLRVRVNPPVAKVLVDAQPVALGADGTAEVRLALGAHQLHAEAVGFATDERALDVDTGGAHVELDLEPRPEPEVQKGPGTRQLVAYSLLGASAVGLGLGIFAGLRAISLADEYNTPGEPRYQDPSVKDTGTRVPDDRRRRVHSRRRLRRRRRGALAHRAASFRHRHGGARARRPAPPRSLLMSDDRKRFSLPPPAELRDKATRFGEQALRKGRPRKRYLGERRVELSRALGFAFSGIATTTLLVAVLDLVLSFFPPERIATIAEVAMTLVAAAAAAATLAFRRDLTRLVVLHGVAGALLLLGFGLVAQGTGGAASPYLFLIPLADMLLATVVPAAVPVAVVCAVASYAAVLLGGPAAPATGAPRSSSASASRPSSSRGRSTPGRSARSCAPSAWRRRRPHAARAGAARRRREARSAPRPRRRHGARAQQRARHQHRVEPAGAA